MSPVTVFTMENCPYCVAAKSLLLQRGVAFKEVVLAQDDDAAWSDLVTQSGLKTVPQIFAGERLIGGFTDLSRLDQQDRLVSLK